MALEINLETIGLMVGITGVIISPLFGFFIKLIIQNGNMESELKFIRKHITTAEGESKDLTQAKSDIRLLDSRVSNLEKTVTFLLERERQQTGDSRWESERRKQKFIDDQDK